MSEFSEKMGMAAGNNFKSGFNCCEAIVETFRKEAGVEIDDNAFRLCSGFGGGIGLGSRFGGRVLGLNSQNSIRERMRAARAADHPIVEASPFANPSGSLQDWSRFRYYPYAYYPHNFSEKANMSVPKYQPGYQNFYPVPRRYHEGSHFILDVF